MRIFASWSGQQSRQVAELLRSWIPNVIQEAEVYVSSQDIGKGERWLSNVGTNLSEIDFGIVAVTPTNLNAPWIQFEAGALSKSVKSRVIPLLCGLNAIEASNNPLTQFQYAIAAEDGELHRVIEQINSVCQHPLDDARLKATYSKWAPDFFAAYNQIDFAAPKVGNAEEVDAPDRLETIEKALNAMVRQMRDISVRIDKRTMEAIERNVTSNLIHIPAATGLAGLYAEFPQTTKERIVEALLAPASPPPQPAANSTQGGLLSLGREILEQRGKGE